MSDAVRPVCPECARAGCDGKRCQETAEGERAAIVAWLRAGARDLPHYPRALAAAIERGEHKRGGGGR